MLRLLTRCHVSRALRSPYRLSSCAPLSISTLVFVEHIDGKPTQSSFSALAAARALANSDTDNNATNSTNSTISKITAAFVSSSHDDVTQSLRSALAPYISELLVTRAPFCDASTIAPVLADLVRNRNATHLLAAGSAVSKDLLPRSAALLGVTAVPDVLAFHSPTSYVRPIYAGNAVCELDVDSSNKNPAVVLIRPTAFPPGPLATETLASSNSGDSSNFLKITEVAQTAEKQKIEVLEVVGGPGKEGGKEMPELTTARVVVAGGRALKSAENFKLVYALATKMGGAVGASRAAVDAGYVDNSLQIGQTGKVVAPELYVALGISGAIQHLSGMKDSKVIVAINNDPESPIFQVADYGLVADLFVAVPELIEKLPEIK